MATKEADRKAFVDLIKIARDIEPGLPEDLNGKTVTISLSLYGNTACAFVAIKKNRQY